MERGRERTHRTQLRGTERETEKERQMGRGVRLKSKKCWETFASPYFFFSCRLSGWSWCSTSLPQVPLSVCLTLFPCRFRFFQNTDLRLVSKWIKNNLRIYCCKAKEHLLVWDTQIWASLWLGDFCGVLLPLSQERKKYLYKRKELQIKSKIISS